MEKKVQDYIIRYLKLNKLNIDILFIMCICVYIMAYNTYNMSAKILTAEKKSIDLERYI